MLSVADFSDMLLMQANENYERMERISCHIMNKDTVTPDERDACIGGMIDVVRDFREETDIEKLPAMTESDVTVRFRTIRQEHNERY